MPDRPDLAALLEERIREAAALTWADLPDGVREHAALVLADTIGVIGAGARSPEVTALVRDPVLGLRSGRGDPATAAWVNGTAGTFLELDEGFRPTGHPAVHVLPAALAVAEVEHAAGTALLTALVAGYEVAARLFESFVLPAPMHPHGHFGGIGAATAVAMLAGADPVALARIAATQSLLTGWEACYEGATARNTWAGHANRSGVQALVLHRSGFRGSLASHLSVVAPYVAVASTLAEPVRPGTLRIRRNYLKLHSACALTHTALDATAQAWSELDAEPGDVEAVEVVTVTNNLRVARTAEPNALSTRFSLPYAVAARIHHGGTDPGHMDWRPEVARLAASVTVRSDPALDALWPGAAPAVVRIRTRRGVAEARVDNPRGHHADPVGRPVLREKFVRLGGDGEVFDALVGVAETADVADLALPEALVRTNSAEGLFTGRPSM
ncbi:MAG: MmgE/PrpD family protein [Nocardioidaceae bacterium]|nr:MmgE/PrpD family protein [Nocardioidaceae bacterium]